MKRIKLSHINRLEFDNAFESFKRFVNGNIEYNTDQGEIWTNSDEFDKWHLVTLASFYGGNLFRATNELELLDHQACEIGFQKTYNSPVVKFRTIWNDEIEIRPIIMSVADFFLTEKLIKALSDDSKKMLIASMPKFNIEQPFYRTKEETEFEHYAYVIIKNTLIFIKDERKEATITDLWKVRWNEI